MEYPTGIPFSLSDADFRVSVSKYCGSIRAASRENVQRFERTNSRDEKGEKIVIAVSSSQQYARKTEQEKLRSLVAIQVDNDQITSSVTQPRRSIVSV